MQELHQANLSVALEDTWKAKENRETLSQITYHLPVLLALC